MSVLAKSDRVVIVNFKYSGVWAMPTVFREAGYRFFFYSNEGDPREPTHIHVQEAGAEAKFWVAEEITLARSDGFDARALRKNTEYYK